MPDSRAPSDPEPAVPSGPAAPPTALAAPADGLRVLAGRVFDAALFDMDGTLIDSTGATERAWRAWGEELGLDPAGWEVAHGVPARTTVGRLIGADRAAAAMARLEELEAAALDGVVVLPGAAEALAATVGRAAIVTSCTPGLARTRMAHTRLAAPAVVVTADDVARGKPHPEPYLWGARLLGVDPARCLVVEDAPAGLAAGRAAGCATLAVCTSHAAGDLDADAVVADLGAVRFTASSEGLRVGAVGPLL